MNVDFFTSPHINVNLREKVKYREFAELCACTQLVLAWLFGLVVQSLLLINKPSACMHSEGYGTWSVCVCLCDIWHYKHQAGI